MKAAPRSLPRAVLVGGLCLMAPAPAGTPWYHRPAPWVTQAAPRPAASSVLFADENNVFGFAPIDRRSHPALADLDDDGDLDALVGGHDGALLFFENTGTTLAPAFAPALTNPFGLVYTGTGAAPAFADLDGDGDTDVLVGEAYGTVAFFENIGTPEVPAFATPLATPFGLTGVPDPNGFGASPAVADVDADGDLDVVLGEGYGTLVFFRNDDPTADHTQPTFSLRTGTDNPLGGVDVGTYSTPAFADLDADGDPDLVVGWFLGDLYYLENTGTAGLPAFASAIANPLGLADAGTHSAPIFGDLDGDGDEDLLVGEAEGRLKYFANAGTPTAPVFAVAMPNPLSLADVGTHSRPVFVDIDDDGDLDAFVGEAGDAIGVDGRLFFYENSGTPTAPDFGPPLTAPFGIQGVRQRSAPAFGDVDGDGDLDLFTGEAVGSLGFFENTGTAGGPAFAVRQEDAFGCALGGASHSTPALGDVDGDGDLDLLVGAAGGGLFFLENTALAGDFACATPGTAAFGLGSVGAYSAPTLADVDGDGDLDVFAGAEDGTLAFFENTGMAMAPAFVARTGAAHPLAGVAAGTHSAPSFADLDGDTDADAFVGAENGTLLFYRNQLDPALPVELTAFTALAEGEAVVLRWTTASEVNHAGFAVEHRPATAQGTGWTKVGFVEGQGHATRAHTYQFRLAGLAPGRHRFRLRQIDRDGTTAYSPEVVVVLAVPGHIVLAPAYPNPFTRQTRITLTLARSQPVRVAVYDLAGRRRALLHDGLLEGDTPHAFTLDGTAWPSGLYVLDVAGAGFRAHQTVMLVR